VRRIETVPPRPTTACVLWEGNINQNGYGRRWVGSGVQRRLVYAHRHAWVEHHGKPIPTGMTIDHLCRTPRCIHPEHLDLVSQSENSRRRSARVTHCPQGHEYDETNTHYTPSGCRTCRACHRVRERIRQHALPKRPPRPVLPRTTCSKGHDLADAYITASSATGRTNRTCRPCQKARYAAYVARKRVAA
jgi:HNH endonuclease